MDTELLPTLPGETTGSPAAKALENGDHKAQGSPSPALNLGGDGASDGGTSTPEQRAKWREKAQRRRLRLSQSGQNLPPVLPAASPTTASETETAGPGVAGLPSVEDIALVDWTEEDIKEVTDELIEWIAILDIDAVRKAAEVAKLGERLIEQIEQDAEMPSICKKIFKKSLPKWLAKMLNKSGLSAEHKELAEIIVGILFYAYHRSSLMSRIKKLAKEAGKTETKP
jgi:hypothetical protein